MEIELSVIVPAYNEADHIMMTIREIIAMCESRDLSFEIVVVDDGSRDRTLEVIRDASAKDLRIRALTNGINRGKGYSVRHGVVESRGAMVLFTDVDLSTPLYELDTLSAVISKGFDVAIGSRALAESKLTRKQPQYRVWLGRIANKAIQVIVPALRGIKDTQCGFKLFKGDIARKIFPLQRIERWGFDFEILHIARKHGFKVAEVPVAWSHSGDSRLRLSDYPKTLMELFKVRINDIKGCYKHIS